MNNWDTWVAEGEQIKVAYQAVTAQQSKIIWTLGDWILRGEREFGERAYQMIDSHDYSLNTIHSARWLASKYAPHERHHEVSIAAYTAAAPLEPVQRSQYLAHVETERPPTDVVRAEVRQIRQLPPKPPKKTYFYPPYDLRIEDNSLVITQDNHEYIFTDIPSLVSQLQTERPAQH